MAARVTLYLNREMRKRFENQEASKAQTLCS